MTENYGQQKPAIHGDDRSGHVARGLRGEQQDRAVEIAFLAESALRNSLDQPLARWRRPEVVIELGVDITGRQRVDANAFRGPLQRERFRQLDQRGFRGG